MIYIFNPYYTLKKDIDRVLLMNSPGFKIPEEKAEDGIISFIHPIYAVILSYFNGELSYEKTIEKIANDFSENIETIKKITDVFIENEDEITFEYENNFFGFPKKMLVKIDDYKEKKRPNYNPYDFYLDTEDYDFKTQRLKTSPSEIRILVNTECASDCIYCYVDRRVKDTCKIPIERIVELIEESKKLGVTTFDIAGTEIFLYKYWDVLVENLIHNGYYPYLSTKIPIGEKIINRLIEIGIKDIQISIDSLIDEEVEKVDKFKITSYSEKILKTLKQIEEAGLNVAINTVITKYNSTIEGIDFMLNKLNQFGNIEIVTINMGETSVYKTEEEFANFKTLLNDINKIEEYYIKNRNNFNFKLELAGYTRKEDFYADPKVKKERFEQRSLCTAGIRQICILPDGKVTGCEELYWHPQFIMGNVMHNTLEEIWNSDKAVNFNNLRREMFSDDSCCKTCYNFEKCRMGAGICYSDVISVYGKNNWDFPAPECPKAPAPKFITYFE